MFEGNFMDRIFNLRPMLQTLQSEELKRCPFTLTSEFLSQAQALVSDDLLHIGTLTMEHE